LEEGFVGYDMIFISFEQVKERFARIVSGSILNIMGRQFLWKRLPGELLILYGKFEDEDEFKDRRPIEICRMRVPEEWIGVGRFVIDWPERKNQEHVTLLLITLYLYSVDISDFDHLDSTDDTAAALMASLFLDKENSELFNEFAEKRFDSLR
jgi:hypothetical protein